MSGAAAGAVMAARQGPKSMVRFLMEKLSRHAPYHRWAQLWWVACCWAWLRAWDSLWTTSCHSSLGRLTQGESSTYLNTLVMMSATSGRSSKPCRCLRILLHWWVFFFGHQGFDLFLVSRVSSRREAFWREYSVEVWEMCASFIQLEKPCIDSKIACIVVRPLAARRHFR